MLETSSATGYGQSARQVHLAMKSALQKLAEAEKSAVICFGEIMTRQLYRQLGYSSIHHYAELELGKLGCTPVRVSLEMTPTQFARYERLWE